MDVITRPVAAVSVGTSILNVATEPLHGILPLLRITWAMSASGAAMGCGVALLPCAMILVAVLLM